MSTISRRKFLKRMLATGVAGGLAISGVPQKVSASNTGTIGSLIDLTLCDGCADLNTPMCVSACRVENKEKFPNPVASEEIENYWPQKKKEDWQDKKEIITRLTPYNWTFVQKVTVEHNGKSRVIYIPRRCMHCDNPPCAKICPFSAQNKTPEGPVVINHDLCFGGAKCRDVCPWGIPARQAGVGLYMKVAPKYLGAGVMYKCDSCYDRLKIGQKPACEEACPRKAIVFGPREEIKQMAIQKAKEINGFLYGINENGGTSTFYISPVPFEKINDKIKEQKSTQPKPETPGYPEMPLNVDNFMESANGFLAGVLAAPVAGVFAAGYAAYKTAKGEE